MNICRKCGLEIDFARHPNGKWMPVNPDGSEHWDRCKQEYRKTHPPRRRKPIVTEGKHKIFYPEDSVLPPWDEALGEFRCYEGCCGPNPDWADLDNHST